MWDLDYYVDECLCRGKHTPADPMLLSACAGISSETRPLCRNSRPPPSQANASQIPRIARHATGRRAFARLQTLPNPKSMGLRRRAPAPIIADPEGPPLNLV